MKWMVPERIAACQLDAGLKFAVALGFKVMARVSPRANQLATTMIYSREPC
jgi:hypothetical protein